MIICKSSAEIERMRVANALVAEILEALESAVGPGVTTKHLDELADQMIQKAGAVSAFKGYRGYPATL